MQECIKTIAIASQTFVCEVSSEPKLLPNNISKLKYPPAISSITISLLVNLKSMSLRYGNIVNLRKGASVMRRSAMVCTMLEAPFITNEITNDKTLFFVKTESKKESEMMGSA